MIDLKGEVGHDVIVPRSSLKSRDDRGTIKGRSPSIVGGPGFFKNPKKFSKILSENFFDNFFQKNFQKNF